MTSRANVIRPTYPERWPNIRTGAAGCACLWKICAATRCSTQLRRSFEIPGGHRNSRIPVGRILHRCARDRAAVRVRTRGVRDPLLTPPTGERGHVSVAGGLPGADDPARTHICRSINGEWVLVHRHADFPPTDPRETNR